MRKKLGTLLPGLALCLFSATAQAIILFRTASPAENTMPPTATFPRSGWDYEGQFGGFCGTPIAPNFFVAASHIGEQGVFVFQGATYHVVAAFQDPAGDLKIYQTAETFPYFAPLYSRTDEVSQRIVDLGRGTQRGADVTLNGVLKGWRDGPSDGVLRWGENQLAGIFQNGADNDLLYSNFDEVGPGKPGLPDECHLSTGDSSGAAFLNDGGTWRLAGINFAVDGPFFTDAAGNGSFVAALFDLRGFYYHSGNSYLLIGGPNAIPASFYVSRISTKLPWIANTIAVPRIGHEGNFATLTYTKLDLPSSELNYTVEQSTDLVSWTTATTADEVVSTNGSTLVVKAKVDTTGLSQIFLRLRSTRP